MWKILQSCTTGQHHIHTGRPCQDRWAVRETENRLVLAVADGHGGNCYCRSGQGAEFACEAACEVLTDETLHFAAAAGEIKARFDKKIAVHLQENPLTLRELELLGGYPEIYAYGTTLLCVAVSEAGVYRCQIGDGEMHLLDTAGQFLPDLPDDPQCVGHFTSSLISPNALQNIRCDFTPRCPGAVLLFSDGYLCRTQRPWQLLQLAEGTENAIPQFLLEQGQRGDDQTILLAFRPEQTTNEAFQRGLARGEQHYCLTAKYNALLQRIHETDVMIRYYIRSLSRCNSIEKRNAWIQKLSSRQEKYLSLCRERIRLLEELTDIDEGGKLSQESS